MTNWTFPHQITVLAGDCDNLQCVGYDDSDGMAGPAVVEWLPEANTQYYFAVQGYGDERLALLPHELGTRPAQGRRLRVTEPIH